MSFGCRWRRQPPVMKGGCKYTKQAVMENRLGTVLQLEGWEGG